MANALIGALRVSLSAETAQFEAGMKRAQRTANQTNSAFKKSFGGLGGIVKAGFAGVISGLSIGLIANGVKAALDYAGSLKEVSDQLGVTTKDLQVFRYAAGQVGVSQETLENGLKKLTITMGQMAAGAKAPREALEAVRKGLADQVLAAGDTGEAFRIIADALSNVSDRSQRAAVEVAVFKKSGADLDNLLVGGSKAINELANAAERLGIVLSAEQIKKADDTADKLDALQTVLSAQIAGVVADNSDAILALADALLVVVSAAAKAINAFSSFVSLVKSNPLAGLSGPAAIAGFLGQQFGGQQLGSSVTVTLPAAKPKPVRGANIGQFLAGGGGRGRSKRSSADDAERQRLEALRDVNSFDQDLRRAQIDVVRAQQQLATDYSERAALAIQILNLEQQGYQAQLKYEVAAGELTKAQAAQLEAEFAKRDALERQAALEEEQAQRLEDYNALEILDLELQRDVLQSQEQLADTSKEQRDVRLRLLDLDYRIERSRLEQVLADEKASYAAKEDARRRLANLNRTFANDREATIRDTAGPFERAQLQFGDLSEEMENLKVQGIMGAADALTALTDGFGSFKDAAISAIKQVIAEFIRLQTIKFLMNAVGSAFGAPGIGSAGNGIGSFGGGASSFSGYVGIGAIPSFATGGGFNILGNPGIDKNVLSLNGLPIARVSHGERLNISNDNMRPAAAGHSLTQNFYGSVSRETAMQAGARAKAGIAAANRKGA